MHQPLEVILVGSPGTGKTRLSTILKEVFKLCGVVKVTSMTRMPNINLPGTIVEWEDKS